jgi:hypothetical protein
MGVLVLGDFPTPTGSRYRGLAAYLRFLPVLRVQKLKRRSSERCKLLHFLIGVKWHGRGRRFDPDQVRQTFFYFLTAKGASVCTIAGSSCGVGNKRCLGVFIGLNLPHHCQLIPVVPALNDFPVLNANHRHPGDSDRFAAGGIPR